MNLCEIFMTFGDCNCNKDWRKLKLHPETTAVKQDFFAAVIEKLDTSSIKIKRCHGQTEPETYFISTHNWHRRGAQRGDSVIFQASGQDVPLHKLRYGRVFQVFRQNAHNLWKQVLVEPLKEGAFTIDAPDTKVRDDAITIEDCREHQNGCKKIGIHITAVALKYPSKWPKPPCYKSWRFLDYNEQKAWSLDQGKIVLALSIYIHTLNDKVDGPVFTPIRIKSNYSFGDEKRLPDTFFTSLWSHFMCKNAPREMLHAHTYLLKYIKDYPKEWKIPALLDKITAAFTSAVTKYVDARGNVRFITKTSTVPPELGSEESVCVFKDLFTNAKKSLNKGDSADDMALLELAVAFKLGQTSMRRVLNHFPGKHQTDVEMSSAFRKDSIVKCTSPLRNFHQFVNQQILISCMTGAGGAIYSQDDLLGLLTVQFKTQLLRKPFVDDITASCIHLSYHKGEGEGVKKVPEDICQLSYRDFSDDVLFNAGSKKADFLLKNVSCKSEDFCNRKMLCLSSAKSEEFITALVGHEASSSLEKMRKILESTETEEITPYQTAGNDTRLCLQKGVELQIQVAETDAKDNIDLGIRLLRVGRNCHFCFTHLHRPEEAFMSDRRDVRELITSNTIEAFQKVKLEEKLNSKKLDNVTITWDGEYGAGGSFTTDAETAVGDLLCIRKEITQNKKLYVWSCHAVVSAFKDATLSFATCTLSQEDSLDSWPASEGFCIEIMSFPLVQDLEGKSQ